MQNEIDLMMMLDRLTNALKKNKLAVALILVLNIGGFAILFETTPEKYETEGVISFTEEFSAIEIDELLQGYMSTVKTESQIKDVELDLKVANTIENLKSEIVDLENNIIKLTLRISDTNNIELVEKNIVNFIRYNEKIKKKHNSISNRYKNTINKISNIQTKLDSIWKIENTFEMNKDLGSVAIASMELQDKKDDYRFLLNEVDNSFKFTSKFQKRNLYIYSPKILYYVIFVILNSIFLTLIYLFLRSRFNKH